MALCHAGCVRSPARAGDRLTMKLIAFTTPGDIAGSRLGPHLLAPAILALAAGCSTTEKAPPKPVSREADRSFVIEVPQIMRGTVGSEAVIVGYQPVLVRGYGLVVGLNGTGHRGMPQDLRASMIALAARQGVGSVTSGGPPLSPEQLLDSMDTAVVVVEALVPPGAKEGTEFDVRVVAHPATRPLSLEGGKLWTAELRPVDVPGRLGAALPPTGTLQAAPLAEARGPLFINPFAEPEAIERDTINRNVGRVLNGGRALKDLPIKLRLANPSHARSRSLQGVINSQFPEERGQGGPTARGESDESIEITVPPSFRDRPEEFVELLRATSLDQGAVEATANTLVKLVQSDPSNARDAALRWQTLGPRALPAIRPLYQYPEDIPRLAALQAGAKLDDPLVVSDLLDLAATGTGDVRTEAIQLLGRMGVNPRIDQGLRPLLNDPDTEVRLAVYEALEHRADPAIERIDVDGKFVIDLVESDYKLIYITQLGRPRIVLMGKDLAIERPTAVFAWSNRFMVKSEPDDSQVEVYYQDERGGRGVISLVDPDLESFVQFLAHKTTVEDPRPGLNLTYSETLGLLHQICRQRYIQADFKAEQDRLLAAIYEQERQSTVVERPEFASGGEPAPAEEAPFEGEPLSVADPSAGG
jgi:hypothetical protein